MGKYRSRFDIIVDVLKAVSEKGLKKTNIMHRANLSYKLLTRYLKDVMDMDLVRVEDGNIYEITEKGSNLLREVNGYRERRVEVEEQLSEIKDVKVMLENRFLNAEDSS